MTIKQRRLHEKAEMKKMIIDASIKIINEQGFDNLSMRKIADQIEYSPTTIYIYYENKAQIAEDLGVRIYEKIVEDIITVLSDNRRSFKEKLELSFKQFILSMTSNPEMGRAFIKSGSNTMFRINPNEKNGENLLQSLLLEGYSTGFLRELNENASWMILTALVGFGMNAIENQNYLQKDWEKTIDEFISILMYGIAKEE